jgi:transposase-like protein
MIPSFAFLAQVRRVICTTNAIESLHMRLCKIIKARGHLPAEEAALKFLWLVLRNITAGWSRGERPRKSAMNQFAIQRAGRREARAA